MAFVGRAILPGNPARSRLSAGFCDNDGVRRESRSRLACGWQTNPLLSTRLELPESSLNRAPEHARQPQVIQSGPAGGPAGLWLAVQTFAFHPTRTARIFAKPCPRAC